MERMHWMWQPVNMEDEPDIRLNGGFSLRVLGRQFPDAVEYHDANWLMVRATMVAAGASVTAEGAILMTADITRFRDELAAMHASLGGMAELSSYEPNLKVTLAAGRLGGISGEIEITPDHLGQFHRFEIGLDQSYLPALIAACDALIERYPVVGRPGA